MTFPDCLYPSNNNLGIPSLLLDMQARTCDLPVIAWGSISRKIKMPGTYHFYTDDYRFEHLWSDPTLLVRSTCQNTVEPNFSVYSQTPTAIAQYQIYRKRWLARYWQSQGIRVFVDLNVPVNYAEENLVGVPAGWAAFATHGYSDRLMSLDFEYNIGKSMAGKKQLLFLVYGGGKIVKEYCLERELIHIPEQEDVKAKKTITEIRKIQLGFM